MAVSKNEIALAKTKASNMARMMTHEERMGELWVNNEIARLQHDTEITTQQGLTDRAVINAKRDITIEGIKSATEIETQQQRTKRVGIKEQGLTDRARIDSQTKIAEAKEQTKQTEIKETSAVIQKQEEEETKRIKIQSEENVEFKKQETIQLGMKIDGIVSLTNSEEKKSLSAEILGIENELSELRQRQRHALEDQNLYMSLENSIQEKEKRLDEYHKRLDDFHEEEKQARLQIVNLR